MRFAPLSIEALPVQASDPDIRAHLAHLSMDTAAELSCWGFERTPLTLVEHRLLDDGDLLPGWAAWWLLLAAELLYGGWAGKTVMLTRSAGPPLFAARPRLDVEPFSVADVAQVLAAPNPSSTGAFALAWGVGEDRPIRSLVSCRGAVFPVADGQAAALYTTPADRHHLRPWLA